MYGHIHWRRLHTEWAVWVSPCGTAFVGSHVDDFIIGASAAQKRDLHDYLSTHLTNTDLGPISIYVGISIIRDRPNRIIRLHQTGYIDDILGRFNMRDCNGIGTPMLNADRDKIVPLSLMILKRRLSNRLLDVSFI